MTKPFGIDLDAAILPGESAAGIVVGSDIRHLLDHECPTRTKELSDLLLYDFGSVRVWSRDDVVQQVGVGKGYRGSLMNQVRIGSSIADIERALRCKVEEDDEDNLVVPELPGVCFETEEWHGNHTIGENKLARITEIFVFGMRGENDFWASRMAHPFARFWRRVGCRTSASRIRNQKWSCHPHL